MIETGPSPELGIMFKIVAFIAVAYLVNGLFEMLRTYGERREIRKEQQNAQKAEAVLKVQTSEKR